MSGHSKWSQIKHKKALTDAKKGKVFSKLARQITIAARDKGGDPETNPVLRMTVEMARSFNMPSENVERAIKRGTGEIEGVKFEEFALEAYGPAGSALIIEGVSDNKNRSVSEIKYLLSQYGGKLANPGSVLWLFEKKGVIIVQPTNKNKDESELAAIDAGAQDLKWVDKTNLEIYTKPEDLEKTKKALEKKGALINQTSLEWLPKNEIAFDDQKSKEQFGKLFEALDENDDVSELYSNVADK